jgi:hypothetical protein
MKGLEVAKKVRSYKKVQSYGKGTKLQKKVRSYEKGTNKVRSYGKGTKLRKRYVVTKKVQISKKLRSYEQGTKMLRCQLYFFCTMFVCLMVFNAIFNNISVMSWQSVLLVQSTRRKPPTGRKSLTKFIT